ncbi:hypothetical protein Nepgr_032012 [Nepenthes gracilis]|uniref:Uncharacterized protein n=1 Tax=Nepenthes gracilis TaxID=150966 RepID=A0AAD3TJB8_NEPGR|nr:hypothetical protein Nepgr_032012 [Nepenthes gracilis]
MRQTTNCHLQRRHNSSLEVSISVQKLGTKPIDDKTEKVTFGTVSIDEERMKKVETLKTRKHDVDTLKHIEKKLAAKGVHRMERHPADGLGGIGKPPPKSGHGGKYTWEGPSGVPESEMSASAAIDENDPNYVAEEEDEKERERGGPDDEIVIGAVEVAKAVENREGVARVEVDPRLAD